MVRELSQPSARFMAPSQPSSSTPGESSSRIPIASSSRLPYARPPLSKSSSSTTSKASTSRRAVLGDRIDPNNIPRSISSTSTKKAPVVKARARLTPKKPITIVTRIASPASPASSATSRADSTPYARRRVSPDMETRAFNIGGDDELLLDMEPPSSVSGMSSPVSEQGGWDGLPRRAVMGPGRMLTPENSQEIPSRKAAPVPRTVTRLPTPPSSQHTEEGETTFRASRIRPREAPTPPRRRASKEPLFISANSSPDPSPNPRHKKTARTDLASPSRPTHGPPTLSGLTRMTQVEVPSTPAASSSKLLPIRVIPSTAPPPRRTRPSVAPKKATSKVTAKSRQSLPAPAKKRSATPRSRQSMTPETIMALTGTPLGVLPEKIVAQPGDDPLILKALDDDDEWVERRRLSRSQSAASSQGSSRKPTKLSRGNGAGPSRLREVVNFDNSPSSSTSRSSRSRQSTLHPESPAVSHTLQQYLEEEARDAGNAEADSGVYDLQFDAAPGWASDDDMDVGDNDVGNDTFAHVSSSKHVESASPSRHTRHGRSETPVGDIEPEALPPSSPIWHGRNQVEMDVSTTPAGTPPVRLQAIVPASPTPTQKFVHGAPEASSSGPSGSIGLDEAQEDQSQGEDVTQEDIATEWDVSTDIAKADARVDESTEEEVDLEMPMKEHLAQIEQNSPGRLSPIAELANSTPEESSSPRGPTENELVSYAEDQDLLADEKTQHDAQDQPAQLEVEEEVIAVTPPIMCLVEAISSTTVEQIIRPSAAIIEAGPSETALNVDSPERNITNDDAFASPQRCPSPVSHTKSPISTTPLGSPLSWSAIPAHSTPINFFTPPPNRRQSRVSLRQATPFRKALADPITPSTPAESEVDEDVTQEAIEGDWKDSQQEGQEEVLAEGDSERESDEEADLSSRAAERLADELFAPDWTAVDIVVNDRFPATSEAASWGEEDDASDHGDEEELDNAQEAADVAASREAESLAPSPYRSVADDSLKETAGAEEGGCDEQVENEERITEGHEVADDNSPPLSPSSLTRTAVAFLMASASASPAHVEESDVDEASEAQGHSEVDNTETSHEDPAAPTSPSPAPPQVVSPRTTIAPASPANSFNGDRTQEANLSTGPFAHTSVDHAGPIFADNVPLIEVEGPESAGLGVNQFDFDFRRDGSPFGASPVVRQMELPMSDDEEVVNGVEGGEGVEEGEKGAGKAVVEEEGIVEEKAGVVFEDVTQEEIVVERAEFANAPDLGAVVPVNLVEAVDEPQEDEQENGEDAAQDAEAPVSSHLAELPAKGTTTAATAAAARAESPVTEQGIFNPEDAVAPEVAHDTPAEFETAGQNDETASRADESTSEHSEGEEEEGEDSEEESPEPEQEDKNRKIILRVIDRGVVKVEPEAGSIDCTEPEGDGIGEVEGEGVTEDEIVVESSHDHDAVEVEQQERVAPAKAALENLNPVNERRESEAATDIAPSPSPPARSAPAISTTGSIIPVSQIAQSLPLVRPATSVPTAPPSHHFANAQSGGISHIESMLFRRQSGSSSTSSRPSKLSHVAASSNPETGDILRATSRQQRRSLGDELASASVVTTTTEVDEDVGNESFKSVVEVSSLDPRAAARAAAILKMNHAYIEHGILPGTSTPGPNTIPLPQTPQPSHKPTRTPRSARRRAFESKHFETLDSARKLDRGELLYEAELEIVASRRSRSRSRGKSLGLGEFGEGYVSDGTDGTDGMELAVPGSWVSPGKRKRERETRGHARSRSMIDTKTGGLHKGKGKESANDDASTAKGKEKDGSRPWGVAEWKRLEKTYRAEKEEWTREREVKPLPVAGFFGWAKKALGASYTTAEAKEWDMERVVRRFVGQERAEELSGEWAEKMIRLRVKALEKRVNAPRERSSAHASNDEKDRRDIKRKRVEHQRRALPPCTPARDDADIGDSTVVSIVPPSTIRRMLGYVWKGGNNDGNTSLASIASIDGVEEDDAGVGVDELATEKAGNIGDEAKNGAGPIENKLLTRLKQVRESTSPSASASGPSTPMRDPAPTRQSGVNANVNAGPSTSAFSPAHPASPAWSPAIPGKWVRNVTSSRPAVSVLRLSSSSSSTPARPATTAREAGSTPKIYPSLDSLESLESLDMVDLAGQGKRQSMTQRSSALQALFDTPSKGDSTSVSAKPIEIPRPRSRLGVSAGSRTRGVDSPSVRDMVRSFEEDGTLGRGLSQGRERSLGRK